MVSRRLTSAAAAAAACLFATTTLAAVPAPTAMPSPTPALMSSGRMALTATEASTTPKMSRAAAVDMLLTMAWTMRDIPYRWGGHAPSTGFDCSGLVRYVYRHALGLDLPHRARLQYRMGEHVARGDLKPGDLVFFRTEGSHVSHVGIYLDNGRFLDAPSSGEVVQVDNLDNPYWSRHYVGARRLGDIVKG